MSNLLLLRSRKMKNKGDMFRRQEPLPFGERQLLPGKALAATIAILVIGTSVAKTSDPIGRQDT
jgi:hypothetical protein